MAADAFELKVKGLKALGFVFVSSPLKSVTMPQLCEVVKGFTWTVYAVCVGEQETADDLYENYGN
ncbi:hypothetical protein GCG54_00015325 [Colletotrichum gloeosporioides]|uniref:Uncharacterized protein n=1 Tax=Colletotrichum gloeosporioides TaxID=474922 RepID=A0A8H4C8J6_COLGL|nr:uncharacterized protein GCG54_00015325 [Colletotrichum gloeosporioides]KAF3799141.1 hypothetical protein GCG54_00015325 [Colletotrichum gloeosporioides]